jgi:hypothetical protein
MLAKLKKNETIPAWQAFKERGGRHVAHQPEKARAQVLHLINLGSIAGRLLRISRGKTGG